MKKIGEIVQMFEEIEKQEGQFKVMSAARLYVRGIKFADTKKRLLITIAKKRTMFFRQKGFCSICDQPMQPSDIRFLQVDHHQPLSKGGENSFLNRGLVHAVCNRIKGSKDVIAMAKRTGETVKVQIERRNP